VDISGSGDVSAAVAQDGQLNARLSGSGDLEWSGKASQKNISRSGSGRASHQD
jgi:hypothetical protein